MYTDKLWTAVSARGGLQRMRAFILEANFSSKAGGSLLQQQEQHGDEWEGSQTPQSLHAAVTATHGDRDLPALWDWEHGTAAERQQLLLSPKRLPRGRDGSQPVPALTPIFPGLASPLIPRIICSLGFATHVKVLPLTLPIPSLGFLDTTAPALRKAPCARDKNYPPLLPPSFASPEKQAGKG